MKSIIMIGLALLCMPVANSQNRITVRVTNEEGALVSGVTVSIKSLQKLSTTNNQGEAALEQIPDGKFEISFSHVSYETHGIHETFPLTDPSVRVIVLHDELHEEEEVVITATRLSRNIAHIPTRVETVSGEELQEKANMKPGEIRMLLSESTGIQTQQTSATSFNSSIRIQGLDGKYTQIIKDGFPLYSGFSGGLSIMQIPPLDLKQVEIIKGSASTLYGGGAIAGMINLVSRTPGQKRVMDFMTNITSAGGLDLSAFYAEKYKKTGLTLYAARNSNTAYDPAKIQLTAIPEFERYTINPRFFMYFSDKTTMDVAVNYITEKRTGGYMGYIKNDEPGYFEKNATNRISTQLSFKHRLSDQSSVNLKSSYSHFNRSIRMPNYLFKGLQQSVFTELNYVHETEKMSWVAGANIITDQFTEEKQAGIIPRDYTQNTIGAFVQHTWDATNWFTLETGLRGDYLRDFRFNLLPRLSALFKITPELSSRLGGGMGYKAPNVFTEDAERIQFHNILPLNIQQAKTERSYGANYDINYKTRLFGRLTFSINQLFFYTRLYDPLMLEEAGNKLEFRNANGYIHTRGTETNIRLAMGDVKLFLGYTFTDVDVHKNAEKTYLPLTARHRLNNVLMYEQHENFRIGLEAYYFSPQKLSDGAMGKAYWVTGIMGEKMWNKFSLFINFENLFDTRQTRFDHIYTGSLQNPVFRDIYAPVDGFVVNGGLKLKL